MDNAIHKIALAALLHDIGKFMQRAEVLLSPESKGMESSLCKSNNKGYYDYRHSLYTNEFFELLSSHSILGRTLEKNSIANLAAYHHNPDSRIQELIQLADWLSSGSDRHEDEECHNDREQHHRRWWQSV